MAIWCVELAFLGDPTNYHKWLRVHKLDKDNAFIKMCRDIYCYEVKSEDFYGPSLAALSKLGRLNWQSYL